MVASYFCSSAKTGTLRKRKRLDRFTTHQTDVCEVNGQSAFRYLLFLRQFSQYLDARAVNTPTHVQDNKAIRSKNWFILQVLPHSGSSSVQLRFNLSSTRSYRADLLNIPVAPIIYKAFQAPPSELSFTT
jgi:hypothetical protein